MLQLTIMTIAGAIMIFFICLWAVSSLVALIRGRGVPYVPLTRDKLDFVNEKIKLNADDRVVDLGCGEGKVLRMFEKQGVIDLTGYEINYWAFLIAKIKNKFHKSKVKVYFKNFNKVDLSQYNVIFCYLLPCVITSLKEKFDRELKPGSRVISYAFEAKDWRTPDVLSDEKGRKIFIYKM
ncbi:MAG: methyltransferase domain-containing protein [Parcubacteria group bacterium]